MRRTYVAAGLGLAIIVASSGLSGLLGSQGGRDEWLLKHQEISDSSGSDSLLSAPSARDDNGVSADSEGDYRKLNNGVQRIPVLAEPEPEPEPEPRVSEPRSLAGISGETSTNIGPVIPADLDQLSYQDLQKMYPSPSEPMHLGAPLDGAEMSGDGRYGSEIRHIGEFLSPESADMAFEDASGASTDVSRHLGVPLHPDDGSGAMPYANEVTPENHLGEPITAEL